MISLPFSTPLGRGRFLATIIAGIALCVAPMLGAVAHAQQCVLNDPPCPTPPPLSVGVQAPGDTVRRNPVTVSVNVSGLGGGYVTATATMDGAAVGAPTWQYESNRASATGYVEVSPQTDGTHTIVITFCESGRSPSCAPDTATFIYKRSPVATTPAAPLVRQEPGSNYRRSFAGCAGCAYATLSYSTPGYRSLDQNRALTLLYSSATSAPRGTVVLDVDANSTPAPDRISIRLLQPNGSLVTLSNGQTEMFYAGDSGMSRISAQFDATQYATNLHSMTAIVRNWWGTTMLEAPPLAIGVPILNDQASGFGVGWRVAGVQLLRLPQGGSGPAIISDNGRILVYQNCGWVCWISPPGAGDTLQWVNNHLQRRYLDGTIVDLDGGTGLHTFTRDRFGLQTTYVYDGYGRLTQITDPAGIVTLIAWSGPPGVARTASITAPYPGGGTTQVNISASGELINIVDPDNVTALTVSYSGTRIASATNRIGATTTYTYDSFGGLATVNGPPALRDDGQVRSSTTTYVSRESALLPAPGTGTQSNPATRVLADNAWVRVTSQRGDNVKMLTNGAGDVMKSVTTDAAGKVDSTIVGYDFNEQPNSVWSTSGTRMEYHWNGALLREAIDNVAGVTTAYDYNAFGQDTATRINGVLQRRNYYSADARSVLDSSMVGSSVSRFTYDGLGRVLTATDPGQHQTSFSYQPNGFQNVASVTKNGSTTQFAYDAFGRTRVVTDPLNRTTITNYDAVNRLLNVTAPGQTTTSRDYDDVNRSYGLTDASGQRYRSVLNALGLPVSDYDPTGSLKTSYRYDSDGNLSSTTSKANRTIGLTRDLKGRVTQIAAGGSITTIAYDTAGKWTAYSNAESSDTVYVDGDGRVTRQTTLRGSQRYAAVTTYGARGQKRSLTISSPQWANSITSEFDADSLLRPDYVGTFDGSWTPITYNQDQRPQTISFPQSGATRRRQTLSYTGSDQLASSTSNVAPDVLSWSYNYDVLGRLSLLAQGEGTYAAVRTADYDAAGRLGHWADNRTVDLPPQWVCDDPGSNELTNCYWYYGTQSQVVRDSTYTYDVVGNRTDLGAVTQTGNRLTYFNGYTMQYDDDGNLVSKVGHGVSQTFSWNALGQLESATTNGVTTSYGYDALGRRIRKTVNGVPTQFLYDGENLVAQLTAAGVRQLEFTYYPGVDSPHSVRESATGNLYYYATSQPGNVIALVNRYNQVVNKYEYTPFGQELSKTEQLVQPFRFAGRELDAESGLYYNRARYYDPSLGRFISEDPIGLAGGVNQYAYAENDPVNRWDPSGTCALMARIETTHYTDGSTTVRVLGYFLQGADCESGGAGGGSPTPAGPKPAPRKPKMCVGLSGEVQFSAGVSGLIGGVSPLGAIFGGGGVNVGFTTSGTIFVQGQATGQAGVGMFAGLGGSIGASYSPTQLESGLTQDNAYQVQLNAGLGESVGVSGTFGGGGGGGSFTPRPKFGLGWGAQASGGPIQTVTAAYRSELLSRLFKTLYCAGR